MLSDEFNAWKKRDLSGTEAVYLILDGIRLGVRAGTREKEAVLAAWAFLSDGSRELVGVSLGNQESCNAWKIFYASTYEHAKEAVEIFKKNWDSKYKSALECLSEDIELCLTYYKYPYRHWKRIRTTNAVERSFREVRSRTRGIGRFKDEQRALTMVYWQMKELKWYGVDMTEEARAILKGIKVLKLKKMAA